MEDLKQEVMSLFNNYIVAIKDEYGITDELEKILKQQIEMDIIKSSE